MIDISVKNTVVTEDNNIGAIICHTPKCTFVTDTLSDNKSLNCKLVRTLDEFNEYFGDPFIDPSVYSDLVLAYDLVRRNVPMYISSVYDMHDVSDDDFSLVSYNGCTEFYFTDKDGYDTVGYKLKSNIKFCQPLIRHIEVTNNGHVLQISVDLFYIDRKQIKSKSEFSSLSDARLYRTIIFSFDIEDVIDSEIKSELSKYGLELVVKNSGGDDKALVSELINHASDVTSIFLKSCLPDDYSEPLHDPEKYVVTKDYWYDTHTNDYRYDFDSDSEGHNDTSVNAYKSAIESLLEVKPSPIMLCLGHLYKSNSIYDKDDPTLCVSSSLVDADPSTHIGIISILLETFDSDCDTYLFTNTPDLSISSTLSLLSADNKYEQTILLGDQYNADLFFGYATDFVDNSLAHPNSRKAVYSAALLSFYKLMLERDTYVTNNYVDLNISNRCVKLVLSEPSAKKLSDARCNSMVIFDIGRPSTYGDRSLSLKPNLRYSHISRNFVRLRRLIKDHLETRKFIVNTYYNIQSCINYIQLNILDDFVSRGVLSNYTLTYSTEYKSVFIHINLLFPSVAETISLDFTI